MCSLVCSLLAFDLKKRTVCFLTCSFVRLIIPYSLLGLKQIVCNLCTLIAYIWLDSVHCVLSHMLKHETHRCTLIAYIWYDSAHCVLSHMLKLETTCCILIAYIWWDSEYCGFSDISYAQAWDSLFHPHYSAFNTHIVHTVRSLIGSSVKLVRLIVPHLLFCPQYSYSAHCALSHMLKLETHCCTLMAYIRLDSAHHALSHKLKRETHYSTFIAYIWSDSAHHALSHMLKCETHYSTLIAYIWQDGAHHALYHML